MKKSLLSAVALTAVMAFSSGAWAESVIAVAGPITGPNAAFGAQLQKGRRAGCRRHQRGWRLQRRADPHRHRRRRLRSEAGHLGRQQDFVADGIKFVVSHFNSGVSIPASEVYAENGILEMTPAATSPAFTDRGLWNVFRTCGRDDQQGSIAGAYLAEKFKDRFKIADPCTTKTPYGQGPISRDQRRR